MSSRKKFLIFVAVFIGSVLYGSSYQQFRHFNIEQPQGLVDARAHVLMSLGRYSEVPKERRYRFVVPYLASLARRGLAPLFPWAAENRQEPGAASEQPPIKDFMVLINLSFYIVNFLFMAGAGFLLFLMLEQLGFKPYLGLIGVCIFLSSRITVLSAATPMVDSVYFFAIALICYLTLTDRLVLLAVLNPLIILSKENIFLVMLMPLLRGKKWIALSVSLLASAAALIGARAYVDAHWAHEAAGAGGLQVIGQVLMQRLGIVWPSLKGLFSIRGLHNLSNGFSFFLAFAAAGFGINGKDRRFAIPHYLLVLVPISLLYCLLAPGFGRMFFAAYPVVIPYALVFIERMVTQFESRERTTAA